MSNKVTNIYIDTAGFCDDAIERVKKAFDAIVDYNKVEKIRPTNAICPAGSAAIYFNGQGYWVYTNPTSPILDNKKSVGLWELESIAFRCKQEKKEEDIPIRNIYIDARELDQEDRLKAYQAIRDVADGEMTGWLPHHLAEDGNNHEALILFDIFAIDDDGDRRFYSGEHAGEIGERLKNAQELTFDQLMSLVH